MLIDDLSVHATGFFFFFFIALYHVIAEIFTIRGPEVCRLISVTAPNAAKEART